MRRSAPLARDGSRLVGVLAERTEQGLEQGMLTSWDEQFRAASDLPVAPAGMGVSVAPCAYS
jgi:hypothetical protein